MDNTEQKLHNYFSNTKNDVIQNLQGIYKDIYTKAIAQHPNNIAVTIISEESSQINGYIRKIRQQLKNSAMEAIVNFGISENYSEVIWAKVMNSLGVPKVELCRSEDIPISNNSAFEQNDASRRTSNQVKDLQRQQMKYGGAAAAGAVAETITLLIVPGWGGLAGIIKIAELFVVGVGVAGVVTTQKKITEINRIYTEERKKQVRKENVESAVSEICQRQCDCNTYIINDWIDKVYDEFINQCKSYL